MTPDNCRAFLIAHHCVEAFADIAVADRLHHHNFTDRMFKHISYLTGCEPEYILLWISWHTHRVTEEMHVLAY